MASLLHSSQQESEDRLSMLPDDILLQIMYHLNLRTQILTSTLSTRWRHLPSMLTDLIINVDEFLPRTETLTTDQLKKSMDVYAETRRLLASTSQHAIKVLCLSFYLTDPHLQAIGSAVSSIVEHGDTKLLEFNMMADWHDLDYKLEASVQLGQRFMAFFGSCPSVFRWLTSLYIENLRFNESDMSSLLDACDQLRFLSMRSCDCGPRSVLKIDAPRSQLMELVFNMFIRVELIQVPKLMHVVCDILVFESPAIVFGHVLLLHDISLSSMIMNQPPLMLSNWLSNVRSLSTLTLDFENWEIWIVTEPAHGPVGPDQNRAGAAAPLVPYRKRNGSRISLNGWPEKAVNFGSTLLREARTKAQESPKRLSLIFCKLRDLHLCGIFFSEHNLEWTLYLLEAAPSLKNFFLKVQRHKCARVCKVIDDQQRTNLQWKASSDFRHHSLNLLDIEGFEVEYKLMKYIRHVMKLAEQLKMIRLQHKEPCDGCDANGRLGFNSSGSEIDTDLTRDILAQGFSAVEIIIV